MSLPAPRTRAALERPYLEPYRTWVPVGWRKDHVPRTAALCGVGAVAGIGAGIVDPGGLGPLYVVLGILLLVVALFRAAGSAATTGAAVRRLTVEWDRDTPLERVRARRAHAGARDPELVHPEYAVTVEDTGHLTLWRFRALLVGEEAGEGEVLVPGRPQHAALPVEQQPFDHADAARAAEQLADLQDRAAALEAEARDRARRALDEAHARGEVADEIATTAAALRHLTGQSGR